MEIFFATLAGTLFGFVLHRIGAANPQNIINMLRLTDLHLMKTILLAVALSSVLLFTGLAIGIIDPGHLSVKSSYWGVIVGGVVLGLGFAISGYCPGTGLAALGDGRKDALFFVLGGLFGAGLYIKVYALFESVPVMQTIAGGKSTFADTGNESYITIIDNMPGIVVALGIAIVMLIAAYRLPSQENS